MQKIKEQVENGELEIAQLNNKGQPVQIPYDQLKWKVDLNKQMTEITKKLKYLSWDQKYQWVNFKRLRANKYYSDKKYHQAINLYMESSMGLDFDDQSRIKIKEQLQYPILINIGTCYYMLKDYQKSLQFFDMILRQSQNAKCYFKKGKVLLEIGKYKEARENLDKAYRLTDDQQLRNSIKGDYGKLDGLKKEERDIYRKMLDIEEQRQQQKLINRQQQQILEYKQRNIFMISYQIIRNGCQKLANGIKEKLINLMDISNRLGAQFF